MSARRRATSLCLVFGLALTACQSEGAVGVRKTSAGFDVVSRCSDAGVAGFAVGADTGARSGPFPILELTALDVQLDEGVDRADVPFAVDASDPGPLYNVVGSFSDIDLSAPLIVDADVAYGLASTRSIVVDLSAMRDGEITVVGDSPDSGQEFSVISARDFETGRTVCELQSWPAWLRVPIAVLVVGGAAAGLVAGVRSTRRHRELRTQQPPPSNES